MKKTFTVAQEELGNRIDQNLEQAEQGNAEEKMLAMPTILESETTSLPSQKKGREVRNMVKQLWLDEEIYNRCVEAQAERKKKRLPSSFDALAYDAIVNYLSAL